MSDCKECMYYTKAFDGLCEKHNKYMHEMHIDFINKCLATPDDEEIKIRY